MTVRGKQPGNCIFDEEQQHGGERDDAENQRNQLGRAVRNILHNSLFPAA